MLPWGYSQLGSHFSFCLHSQRHVFHLYDPLTPRRMQIKGIVGHILPGPQPPQEPGRLSKQACPGAPPVAWELGSPTEVASLLKEECHRKGCDCARNACAVCLPLACGSRSQASWSFLQLSSHSELITHLKTQQPCPQPSDESESFPDLFPTCWLLH